MKKNIILKIWLCLELCHQVKQRYVCSQDFVYRWERYAVMRNKESLDYIQQYFLNCYGKEDFHHDESAEGDRHLSELPANIQTAILNLKEDLIGGLDLSKSRQDFSIYYLKKQQTYDISIRAGAHWRQDFNGYNLSITISNSKLVNEYEVEISPNLYVYEAFNKDYRWPPLILSYNCNSYDLLIWKLFRYKPKKLPAKVCDQ